MNEQKMQNYLCKLKTGETINTLSKSIDLIYQELKEFKDFIIENDVWYIYKHGIVNKQCNWLDFHKVDNNEKFRTQINYYKKCSEDLIGRKLSLTEFGNLINLMRNDNE